MIDLLPERPRLLRAGLRLFRPAGIYFTLDPGADGRAMIVARWGLALRVKTDIPTLRRTGLSEFRNRLLSLMLLLLIPGCPAIGADNYECVAAAKPPKLPVTRASGRDYSGSKLRVQYLTGFADTWKPTRREIGSVAAGTTVEVLEDLIVVDAPDIVTVTTPIGTMNVQEGDTILRYAHLGEGWADLWANGCWYKQANADFIVDPDGAGCGGDQCSAKVTKLGRQMWWFHIKLPNGKTGWTLSQSLDLSAGG